MKPLTLEEFERERDVFDETVQATPGIDTFCSASDWILAAREAWMADEEPWLRRGEHGYAAMVRHHGGVRALLGFDTMWGFACPLVGTPHALVPEFLAACDKEHSTWDVVLIAGIEEGSALHFELVHHFDPVYEVRRGTSLRRWVASLAGGWDAYLERRTPKFRENLRRAERRGQDEGITFEAWTGGDDVDALMTRILDVEAASWKGPLGTGLMADEMRHFYGALARRLVPRGRLRARFARRDGEDVGYILGAAHPGGYRGFQFSFDRRLSHVSLGSLLQADQIRALCDEGVAVYDLGIDMAYKRHWADAPHDTITIAIV